MTSDILNLALRLFHTRGVSAATLRQILHHGSDMSPAGLLSQHISDAVERELVNTAITACRSGLANTMEAELSTQARDWSSQSGHAILLASDPDYPAILKEIPDYPPLLFVRGDLDCLKRPMIAIVGSRSSTAYGRSVAYRIASDLAAVGLVVCSGLASGIDTQAHSAAVDAGAPTVAVLGNGLGSVYPPANTMLSQRIIQCSSGGALISELPLSAGPVAQHFPQRNRIISGLSLGTLVVEANMRSGSLITARLALEQNREVFAVPGSVNSPVSRGCHRLIRQGAVLTETADDIVEHIRFLCQAQLAMSYPDFAFMDAGAADDSTRRVASVPRHLHKLYSELCDDPVTVDQLMIRTGHDLPGLSAGLLELELAGLAGHVGNRWWRLP